MLLLGDCNDHLKDIRDNSIDLIVTDPPYGIEFMGKDWDKALVPTETWKECYRVLKEGKLAFVMCSPRQDVLSRMIVNLQDAGFRTNYTSIYWTFASGFPKAANISKLIDKRFKIKDDYKINMEPYIKFSQYLKDSRIKQNKSVRDIAKLFPSESGGLTGIVWNWENIGRTTIRIPEPEQYNILKKELNLDNSWDDFVYNNREAIRKWEEAQREITGYDKYTKGWSSEGSNKGWKAEAHKKYDKRAFTKPATIEAKKMEGAYVGFQPKPAVEVILVVSKGKTLTWLDDARIPYNKETDEQPRIRQDKTITRQETHGYSGILGKIQDAEYFNEKGRFPANLLVSDDVLNDGSIHKSGKFTADHKARNVRSVYGDYNGDVEYNYKGDEGSYSRYFSLDAWAKTFPFLIVPKASASERNKGCDDLPFREMPHSTAMKCAKCGLKILGNPPPTCKCETKQEIRKTSQNHHPTVKPLKLMSYLITMGSREGDLVLDPFCGSGTVCIAAHQLHRKWLGIEMNPEYAEIIKKRLADPLAQLKLTSYLEDKIPQA